MIDAIASSDRVRIRRGPRKARYDREAVDLVTAHALVAHVAFCDDGQPLCIPMLFAPIGERIYVHGSRGSRALKVLGAGVPACLTISIVDGVVLARSAFEHTANYAALMVLGSFDAVSDPDEKLLALKAFIERLVPGRSSEVRAPNTKELLATAVLSIGLEEFSVKLRCGPPDDDDSPDADGLTWAGVLPLHTHLGAPLPSPGLRGGIPLAQSIQDLAVAPSAVTTHCPLIGGEPQLAADSEERRAALLVSSEPGGRLA